MRALVLAVVAAAGCFGSARASYTVSFAQVGNDVVASGSGSLGTGGLTFLQAANTAAEVIPNDAAEFTGPTAAQTNVFRFGSGLPAAVFGPGSGRLADIGTGDQVGILVQSGLVFLPVAYASGGPLLGTATYQGATILGLGLLPGSYVYSLGTGSNADTFTVNVGAVAVPEPAALAVLGFALLGLAAGRRRRPASR